MKFYVKGDNNLVTEYVNYRLQVNSKEISEETVNRIKQFQASFNQGFVDYSEDRVYGKDADGNVVVVNDEYNPYTDENYFKPGMNLEEAKNSPQLYPNGAIDIYTLTALLDTDISVYDSNKIVQAQQCLSNTKYSEYSILKQNGVYDEATRKVIRNYQRANDIYQVHYPIINNDNELPNIEEQWHQGGIDIFSEDASYGDYFESENYVYSDLIPVNNDYNYYLKSYDDKYAVAILLYFDRSLVDPFGLNKENLINKPIFKENYACEYERVYDTEDDVWYYKILVYAIDKFIVDEEGRNLLDYYLTEGPISYSIPPYNMEAYRNRYVKYIRIVVYNKEGTITPKDMEWVPIKLVQGDDPGEYEPKELNDSNIYFSGILNIPTYNAMKKEFGLTEEL